MSVWKGWQTDLLGAVQLPNTAENRQFLSDWHANANTDCRLNPIDLHLKEPKLTGGAKGTTSTDCARIYVFQQPAHAQAYTDRVWARTAFAGQIGSGKYPHLLAAFKSGDPYKADSSTPVATDLGNWGSDNFTNVYIDELFQGGPPPTLKAPQALHGWHDLQRSVNRSLPAALHASQHARTAALRELRRARKVRL